MSKKTIVVVGAGRGLGNSIAERFAKENFRVVLIARRKNLLNEYVKEFTAKNFEVYGKAADVTDFASITKIFAEIQQEFGVVDVLAYNAANMNGGKLTELPVEEIISHFKVDVAGAIHCVQQVLPKQIEQKSGAIIFTGGLFGVFPNHNKDFACMSMDKSALRAVAKMLNEDLKDKGIFAGIVQVMGVMNTAEYFTTDEVAEEFWKLYTEKKDFEKIFVR